MDILKKYTNPSPTPGDTGSPGQPDAPDATTGNDPFEPEIKGGLVRLPSSVAFMLDLRFRTGNRRAVPYGYISAITLDPSDALEIKAPDLVIKIRGRLLEQVYLALVSHTALAVIESSVQVDEGDPVPFIESIDIEQPSDEDQAAV